MKKFENLEVPEWVVALDFFLLIVFEFLLILGALGYLTSINLVYPQKGLPLLKRRKQDIRDLSIAFISAIISAIIGVIITPILGK